VLSVATAQVVDDHLKLGLPGSARSRARRRRAIERALWLALAVMLAAIFAAGISQTLK
jgi:hypothetical protein